MIGGDAAAIIGIALAAGLTEHSEAIIARADEAMYRAKGAGRSYEVAEGGRDQPFPLRAALVRREARVGLR